MMCRMVCWPVYIVGGFFISLLLVDMYQYSWDSLPYHAGLGICFTGLYYLFCLFFGNEVSMGVIFVPAVFILMFFLASWLLYKNMEARKCCMTCNTDSSNEDGSAAKNQGNPFMEFIEWLIQEPKEECSKAV
jgi:hypothetical protein